MKRRDRRVGLVVGGAAAAGTLAALLGIGTAGTALAGAYAYGNGAQASLGSTTVAVPHGFKVRGAHFKAGSTIKIHWVYGTGSHSTSYRASDPSATAGSTGSWVTAERAFKRGSAYVVLDGVSASNHAVHLRLHITVS